MRGYKHLTKEKRIKLEALIEAGHKPAEIAKQLGCARSTVYREVKRGLYERNIDWRFECRYSADIGQQVHDYHATNKGAPLKIGNDYEFLEFVEHKIVDEKYSPDAVIGYIKSHELQFKGIVCTRTLYNYIDSGDIFPHITKESLWMKGKRKRKHDKIKAIRVKKPLAKSIEDRPKEVEDRAVYGDWEMDTVIGKAAGKNPVLLVFTERKSRFEIIRKIPAKTQEAVAHELDRLEREVGALFPKVFRTITIDNGCEFLNEYLIESSINGGKRTDVYYCHPYNSFERGSNENANRMIRRFIPKGEDIDQYSEEYIGDTQNWMNNYPRRILGYKTPAEILAEAFGFAI